MLDGENGPALQGSFRTCGVPGVLRQGIWFWGREISDNWLVGQGGGVARSREKRVFDTSQQRPSRSGIRM